MRVLCLAALTIVASLFAGSAAADALRSIVVWPSAPAVLKTGTNVRIDFSYRISDSAGARVVVVPQKGRAVAEGHQTSRSRLYRGSGRGHVTFTLKNPGDIDRIRLELRYASNRKREVKTVRAAYRFAKNPLAVAGAGIHRLPANRPVLKVRPDYAALKRLAETPRLPRLIVSDALVAIPRRQLLHRPSFRLDPVLQTPEGEETVLYQTIMSPPQPLEEQAGADGEWVATLNHWLEMMSLMMWFDISRLIGDPAALEQIEADEAAQTSSIYEQLQFRRHMIGHLLDAL